MSAETLLDEIEEKMMASFEAMERDFSGFRTGKASPALVEGIMVEYYGTQTRLKDIAGISSPEPRLLVIQPYDQNATKDIERAILTSNIGISPVNDGRVIRLPIPELSEERRLELIKQVKKRGEECKVSIRNYRREANDTAKKYEKSSDITEDDLKDMLDDIQKLTDNYTGQIDQSISKKETELSTI